jgi:hypothetical protein
MLEAKRAMEMGATQIDMVILSVDKNSILTILYYRIKFYNIEENKGKFKQLNLPVRW